MSGRSSSAGGGKRWIAAVFVLLAGNLAAVGVLIAASGSGASHHVVPDYYTRAVQWDGEMAQARANLALGWTVTLDLDRREGGDLGFAVSVRGADGAPVTGAAVSLAAFHRARAGDRQEARLAETAGRYHASLPLARDGIYEVALVVEAAPGPDGPRRWTDVLVREIEPPEEARR